MKKIIMILAVFWLSGCSFFWEEQPKPRKQQVAKPVVKKTAIKGVITELTYIETGYCYTIISTDTTHAKMQNAKFCSPKFYYNKGDLVYAVFLGDKVESMLLIKEAQQKQKSIAKSTPKSVQTNRKNIKSNIVAPKEEKISFD